MSASTKLKRTLALALAGGSLAIGVPAALAASSGGGDGAAPAAPTSTFIQDEQDRARPDREDCPEKDGAQGGGDEGQGGSAEQGGSTAAPSV